MIIHLNPRFYKTRGSLHIIRSAGALFTMDVNMMFNLTSSCRPLTRGDSPQCGVIPHCVGKCRQRRQKGRAPARRCHEVTEGTGSCQEGFALTHLKCEAPLRHRNSKFNTQHSKFIIMRSFASPPQFYILHFTFYIRSRSEP